MYKKLTKNMGVKIFCVIAATVLWAYVSAGQNTVGKFPGSIKVKAINTPQNLEAIYDAKIINIKIMAEPTVWQRLSADTFSAYIDLSGLSEGTHEVPVAVTSSIPDVQIVEKNPDKIIVSLEPLITKDLSITSRTEGEAAEGMVPGSITFTPDKVSVRGPKSIVSTLNEVVSVIHLNGESEDFEKTVKLEAINDQGDAISGLTINQSEAKVNVSIVKAANNKTVGIKVKTTGSPKMGYFISEISTTPSNVDITGKSSTMSDVSYIETFGVDIGEMSENFETEAYLNVKNGIALQPGSPNKVKINIKFELSEIFKEITPTISFIGLDSSYYVSSIDPSIIKVICLGSRELLSGLKSEDVSLAIDLNNISLDKAKIETTIDLSASMVKVPEGVRINSIIPTAIKLTLQKR